MNVHHIKWEMKQICFSSKLCCFAFFLLLTYYVTCIISSHNICVLCSWNIMLSLYEEQFYWSICEIDITKNILRAFRDVTNWVRVNRVFKRSWIVPIRAISPLALIMPSLQIKTYINVQNDIIVIVCCLKMPRD